MPIGRQLIERMQRRLPRRTVRLRLTLLYGALFLASGVALLGITYVLVDHATSGACLTTTASSKNVATTCRASGSGLNAGKAHGTVLERTAGTPLPPLTPQQLTAQANQLRAQASHQRAAELHALLEQSGIALALMSIVSIALGWVIAGRVLRPLRTITSTARRLSASNLHERLALEGPDDELKELGETFDALLERLEASFRSQRQFVANASHELRTPLARQRTLIQVALGDPDADIATLRAAHERVLAAGTEQERCIDGLLALSRGQAGIDRRARIDLATVADETVLTHAGDAAREDVIVLTSFASAPIAGDVRLIERMLANMLENALRYNVAGGSVRIETAARDGLATCTVTNTGPVVAHDAVARLVEPFRRLGAERTGRGNGLGLGLSIVKAIAEAHDATLDLQPRAGGGLIVEVAFPLAGTAVEPAKHVDAAPVLVPQPVA